MAGMNDILTLREVVDQLRAIAQRAGCSASLSLHEDGVIEVVCGEHSIKTEIENLKASIEFLSEDMEQYRVTVPMIIAGQDALKQYNVGAIGLADVYRAMKAAENKPATRWTTERPEDPHDEPGKYRG